MPDDEWALLEEMDRLLNDPEVVLEPGRVWRLAAAVAEAPGAGASGGVAGVGFLPDCGEGGGVDGRVALGGGEACVA